MPSDPTKTLRQAAVDLLRDIGPTHYQELTERILSQGRFLVQDASRVVERRDRCRHQAERDQERFR